VTLAACAVAQVDEVYAVGGAQAIAALAYGTDSIDPVEVVVGPGNAYVNEAKRIVSGTVGIDGMAGPSELLIVADAATGRARWLALDLAAQAEHGEDSPVVMVSPDAGLLDDVAREAEELWTERASVRDAPLALVAAPGLESALQLADAFAPEHLELAFAGADENVARSRVAGCVFVGSRAATAFGDYAVGSNHVLPTGGAARFGGPLGVRTFRRRSSIVTIPASAAEKLADTVGALARAEGFPVHGESAEARREEE
jgi:histidinol dehydrogenase